MQKIYSLFSCLFCVTTVYAQVTSGAIEGYVWRKDSIVPGCLVLMVDTTNHQTYRTYTNRKGYYAINNILPHEHYTIYAITGISDTIYTQSVAIVLGETTIAQIHAQPIVNQLADVSVEARSRIRYYGGSVKKFAPLSPQTAGLHGGLFNYFSSVQILANGGISIAQQNPRLNAIYVDGSLQNDQYGLSPTGMYGGQAGSFPIHADEVEQVQVVSSSYDASLGNFTGGAINITSKAGSNRFRQRYFIERGMGASAQSRQGFQLSGPIRENKLFFHVHAEWNDHHFTQPVNFDAYSGDTKNQTQHQAFRHTVNALYGYDIGGTDNMEVRQQKKIRARFDWGIGNHNKIIVHFRMQQYQRYRSLSSDNDIIRYSNNGKNLTGESAFATVEWKKWWKTSSNRMLLSYQSNNDHTQSGNAHFPFLKILDGDGFIYAGTQPDAMLNHIKQQQVSLHNKWQLQGKKTMTTIGGEITQLLINNQFQPNAFGTYFYYSISDFLHHKRPGNYERVLYTHQSPIRFMHRKMLGFVQFNYRFNGTWRSDAGLRVEKDQVTAISLAPRWALSYQRPGNKWRAEMGVGLFTGSIPLSWVSGATLFNGQHNLSFVPSMNGLRQVRFKPDPLLQWRPEDTNDTAGSGVANTIASPLKSPSLWKTSISISNRISHKCSMQVEALVFMNKNEIEVSKSNLYDSIVRLAGPDTRQVYRSNTLPSSAVYHLQNPERGTGYGYLFSAHMEYKKGGINATAAYAYGDAFSVHDGNSILLESQWKFRETVEGRNKPTLSRSNYSMGHFLQVKWQQQFERKKTTTIISLEYIMKSGAPFSFVYEKKSLTQDDTSAPGFDLIYVPNENDILQQIFIPQVFDGVYYSDAEQKKLLLYYISNNKYLRSRQGMYSERNGSRYPAWHQLHVTITHSRKFTLYRNRLMVTGFLSCFNLQSFLGHAIERQQSGNISLINFEGYLPNSYLPTYSFHPKHITINANKSMEAIFPENGSNFYVKMGLSVSIY